MSKELPHTPDLQLTRLADKQVFDRDALYELIDRSVYGHVAFNREGQPFVLPVGIGRDGDSLLIHGSTGSGFFRDLADGRPVAVAITSLEGMVYARSAFESSFHYSSAMVTGSFEVVPDEDKTAALEILTNHMQPGRWNEVREMSKKEFVATMVLRISLEHASLKISHEPPEEFEGDGEDYSVWAGTLSLRTVAGEPETSKLTPEGTPVSASVLRQKQKLV